MTASIPIPLLFRRLTVAALAMLAFAPLSAAVGATAAPGASVIAVQPTRVADLVLLGGGFDAGLRPGMICRITRGTTEIAEVILVDLRPACSAALILTLAPKQSIRAGDFASVKLQRS
jgi:hypothetical protein